MLRFVAESELLSLRRIIAFGVREGFDWSSFASKDV